MDNKTLNYVLKMLNYSLNPTSKETTIILLQEQVHNIMSKELIRFQTIKIFRIALF